MNFYLILASLCLGLITAAPYLDQSLDAHWYQWKAQHGKTYAENEDIWRQATWEKNLRMIEIYNLEYSVGKQSFQMAMNKFGDMTNEEFKQVMNGFRQNRVQKKANGTLFHEPILAPLPKHVDWRKKGYVTPVKDQGLYGSCWAFSSAGAVEGQWFHKTGKLVSLSEQNLVDCSRDKSTGGCRGGWMDDAFKYVMKNGGIDTEESYPYEAKDGQCQYRTEGVGANVTGFVDIPSEDEKALAKAVATVGPITVAIDAYSKSFQFYKSGVYYEPTCNSNMLTHAVLAVGYGVEEESGKKYWIVKNSWSEEWGEHGYILMTKDENNHCGIATAASYPIV